MFACKDWQLISSGHQVSRVLEEFHGAGKPQALCCIAPVIAAKVKFLKNQNLLAVRFSAFPLSHLFSLKVLGSKGVSLTLGNQGSEADWPYQGAIEAAKVSFLAGDKFVVSYWPPSCRALEPTWS